MVGDWDAPMHMGASDSGSVNNERVLEMPTGSMESLWLLLVSHWTLGVGHLGTMGACTWVFSNLDSFLDPFMWV